jgi:hypothetical protein
VIFNICLIHYNFIRPHISLDGKTTAEITGISIEENNKWLTLMKKTQIED